MDTAPSAPTEPSRMIHVGRQPVYDRAGDVVAYELLFREAADAVEASRRSAHATSRVIVAAFTEFGLRQLVGDRACFVNITREFLVGELPIPFEADQAVLEIVETVQVDADVIRGVADLVHRGFTIALDDFVWGQGHEQLLDLATYVKIDVLDRDPGVVADAVRQCREHGQVQLVAERLETEEQLQLAFDLGFDFFQGYILGRPHVLSMVEMSPARISRLQLVTALSDPETHVDQAVALITRDATLSFRVLHATNSAASGLTSRVSSIHEAIMLLGLEKVRSWVTLMLVSDLAEASEEQLATTMTRARVCETVAARLGLPRAPAFTVGLLSGIGEILSQPPDELVGDLPLAHEVESALTQGAGELGRVLGAVRDYERGYLAGASALLPPEELVHEYLAGLGWSNEILRSVPTPGPS